MAFDAVEGYRKRGNWGLRPCSLEEHPPRQVAAEFDQMLGGHAVADQDDAGPGRLPGALSECRRKPEGMEEYLYWSFVEFGLKTVLRVNHVVMYPLPGDGPGALGAGQPADLRQPLLSERAGSAAAGRRPGAAGTGALSDGPQRRAARRDHGPVWRPGALQDPQRLARGAAQDAGRHQAAMRGAIAGPAVNRRPELRQHVGRNFSSGNTAAGGKQRRQSFVVLTVKEVPMRVRFVVALVLAGLAGVVTLADRPSAAPAAPAVGPTFESIGPLAFGPGNVLFAADTDVGGHRRPRAECAAAGGTRREGGLPSRPEDSAALLGIYACGDCGHRHGRAAVDCRNVVLRGDARPGRRRQGRPRPPPTAAGR